MKNKKHFLGIANCRLRQNWDGIVNSFAIEIDRNQIKLNCKCVYNLMARNIKLY